MSTEPNKYKTILYFSKILFKIILVASIFTIIAYRTDIHSIYRHISNTSATPLFLALGLFLINRILTAFKWDLLLKHNDVKAGLLKLTRIMFESSFIGIAIPSGLGPDIIRLIQLRTHKHNLTAATSSVLADRMLAVLSLAALSGISTIACRGMIDNKSILISVLASSFLLILIITGIMTKFSFRIYAKIHDRIFGFARNQVSTTNTIMFHQKLRSKVEDIHKSFNGLLSKPSLFASILALNMLVQIIRIAQICLLFLALGANVPLISIAAFYPIILLIKLLPFVPFMGIGVQEGAFVYLFNTVGITPETAISVSLLSHIIVITGLLPGAAMLLVGRKRD